MKLSENKNIKVLAVKKEEKYRFIEYQGKMAINYETLAILKPNIKSLAGAPIVVQHNSKYYIKALFHPENSFTDFKESNAHPMYFNSND